MYLLKCYYLTAKHLLPEKNFKTNYKLNKLKLINTKKRKKKFKLIKVLMLKFYKFTVTYSIKK